MTDAGALKKICKKCGVSKPLTQYKKYWGNGIVYRATCKECLRAAKSVMAGDVMNAKFAGSVAAAKAHLLEALNRVEQLEGDDPRTIYLQFDLNIEYRVMKAGKAE